MRHFSYVFLTLLALTSVAHAQGAQLHVVGVYEGNDKTDGRIHGPEVRVQVDQTEAPVFLALTSYEAVRWHIKTAPGAKIEKIYVGGYDGKGSEVFVNDTPVETIVLEGNTYSYRARGKPFRQLVASLTAQLGVSRLASFSGAYRPKPNQVFVVDQPSQAVQLEPAYLSDLVRPEALPSPWKPLLETPPVQSVRFTDDGFAMRAGDDEVRIPVTLDVPRISWPMGAAFDATKNRIFGVTLGGEGYLYQYDMVGERWSVLTSMDNHDANGMLFDPNHNRLIMGTRHSRTPTFVVYDLQVGGFLQVEVDHSSLIGYFDLYDIGNGPVVPLLPIAVEGDTLLAQAGGTDYYRGHRSSQASRTYVIDMTSGHATLVDFQEAPIR